MKRIVRLLLPPIIPKLMEKFLGKKNLKYSSYDDALKSIQTNGYDDSEITDYVVQKNQNFKNQLNSRLSLLDSGSWRTLLAISFISSKKSVNILDFGGGAGYHYFIANHVFPDKNINWTVVETKEMVSSTQQLSNDRLSFISEVGQYQEQVGTVDMVFASGSLQYVPNPFGTLKSLIGINSKYLFITRTPLSNDDDSHISIQESLLSSNGPGFLDKSNAGKIIKYPFTVVSKKKFEEILGEKYDILFVLDEDKNAYKVGDKMFDMYGYFCVLRG